MHFQNRALRLATWLLLAAPGLSQAVPLRVDFGFTVGPAVFPASTPVAGNFTFDSSLIPAGGTGSVSDGVSGLPTLDLQVDAGSLSFNESSSRISSLSFTNGLLDFWLIGALYTPSACGTTTFGCVDVSGTQPDFFVTGRRGGGLRAAFAVPGARSEAGVAWEPVPPWSVSTVTVPEPATLTLLGFGLAGIGFARRKRAA